MAKDNNKKDPFEEFFQQKAEEYDISFRENDWKDLERKLDMRDAQISYQRKVRWIAAASILIISLLGFFTYQNYSKINQLNQLLENQVTASEENETPETSTEDTNQPPNPEIKEGESLASNENTESENNLPVTPTPDHTSPKNTTVNSTEIDPEKVSNTEIITTFNEESFTPITTELVSEPVLASAGGMNEPTIPGGTYGASATAPAMTGNTRLAFPSDHRMPPAFASSRFAVSLLVSPDLSSVEASSGFGKMGYKIGLTVNYKVTPRLSLQTGLVQSSVYYGVGGSSYNPSSAANGYYTPDEVSAKCLILDIPIHAKYEVLQFKHSRFFASAGLSSYIMQEEHYSFSYDNNYSNQPESWSDRTGTRHWFSNAALSIGYELDVHRHWGVQVQPFMNIPLKEIGWGNVKLYSMGSFVSINYKL